jgi:hypothetical protein
LPPRFHIRSGGIILFLGDRAALHQSFGALEILHGEIPLGLRSLEFGLGALGRRRIWPGIDDEKEIARLHDLPVLEMNGIQVATDSRPHFD